MRSEHNLEGTDDPVWFDYFVEELRRPPRRLGILAGDVLADFRAALDHAAWALMAKEKGLRFTEANYTKVFFPICDTEKHFNNRWPVQQLSVPAQTALQGAQPYVHTKKDPRRDALWTLQELANIDKHRTLNLVVLVPHDFMLSAPALPGGTVDVIETGPLYVGAHVVHFSAPRPPWGTYVQVHARVQAEICVEKGPRSAGIALHIGFLEIRRRVREALKAVRPLVR